MLMNYSSRGVYKFGIIVIIIIVTQVSSLCVFQQIGYLMQNGNTQFINGRPSNRIVVIELLIVDSSLTVSYENYISNLHKHFDRFPHDDVFSPFACLPSFRIRLAQVTYDPH